MQKKCFNMFLSDITMIAQCNLILFLQLKIKGCSLRGKRCTKLLQIFVKDLLRMRDRPMAIASSRHWRHWEKSDLKSYFVDALRTPRILFIFLDLEIDLEKASIFKHGAQTVQCPKVPVQIISWGKNSCMKIAWTQIVK